MSYALIRITNPADWRDYHDIRRSSLWVERGLTGYDDARPEERLPHRHSLLLKFEGRAIGTTRLDEHLNGDGIVRLVAVTAAERGKGHGRVLNARVERYALKLGIKKFSSVPRERPRASTWRPDGRLRRCLTERTTTSLRWRRRSSTLKPAITALARSGCA